MMKKIKVILSLLLALVCLNPTCNHIHDENCGFNPKTGTGCTHQCYDPLFGHRDPDA